MGRAILNGEGSEMKYIPLSKGKFAIVDDDDYAYLMQWKWYAQKGKGTFYAARHESFADGRRIVYMHRQMLNVPAHQETDHINHNGLDNRQCNLRLCSGSENQHNQLPQTNCESKYKGVFRNAANWQARITCDYKAIHLGTYGSEAQAAKAYDAKAKALYGEFAETNF